MVVRGASPARPKILRRPPEPWKEHAHSSDGGGIGQATLNLAQGMRVNQLDALRLDGSILGMLRQDFMECFRFFDQPVLLEAIRPEIEFVIGSLIFLFTLWKQRPTPGMKLQNVAVASYIFNMSELRVKN